VNVEEENSLNSSDQNLQSSNDQEVSESILQSTDEITSNVCTDTTLDGPQENSNNIIENTTITQESSTASTIDDVENPKKVEINSKRPRKSKKKAAVAADNQIPEPIQSVVPVVPKRSSVRLFDIFKTDAKKQQRDAINNRNERIHNCLKSLGAMTYKPHGTNCLQFLFRGWTDFYDPSVVNIVQSIFPNEVEVNDISNANENIAVDGNVSISKIENTSHSEENNTLLPSEIITEKVDSEAMDICISTSVTCNDDNAADTSNEKLVSQSATQLEKHDENGDSLKPTDGNVYWEKYRICAFCHDVKEDNICGRLLPLSGGLKYAHVNCIKYSDCTKETKDGYLVLKDVNR
jgi:hypothetical protein